MIDAKVKGVLCAIGAAVSYGLNPLGALPLYADGISTSTVLFYRYSLAVVMLTLWLAVRRKSFVVRRRQLVVIVPLGILFALSSITLFYSFHYMAAGIACTLLFVYPVMVAAMMSLFFHEKLTPAAVISIVLALVGIALLYKGDGGEALSFTGVMFVFASSLSYAVYIIIVNKSSLGMSSVKLTYYVLIVGVMVILLNAHSGDDGYGIQLLHTWRQWCCALVLALFPTVISLVLMAVAVKLVGSTPTAVIGALEPVTAVVVGVTLFSEPLTWRLSIGIVLILFAVVLILRHPSHH